MGLRLVPTKTHRRGNPTSQSHGPIGRRRPTAAALPKGRQDVQKLGRWGAALLSVAVIATAVAFHGVAGATTSTAPRYTRVHMSVTTTSDWTNVIVPNTSTV